MTNSKILLLSRLIVLTFWVTFIYSPVYAQTNPYNEVTIASPTAASLGKYADIPVNNHTGIPNISIPLYTVEEGALKLPISLSYHAGGLRVMEAASWVGAGWSLNAGGVITRAVRGAPDERRTSSVPYHDYGYFSDKGFTSYAFYQLPGQPEVHGESNEFAAGRRDGEPDLFTFNVGGLSGKFYFRDDRTPVFEPQQDIKVEYSYTGVGSIETFILTAPDGTRYHFGNRNSESYAIPVERTNPVRDELYFQPGTVISSWYLSKIESADQLSAIALHYAAEKYSSYTLSMPPLTSNGNWLMNSEDLSTWYLSNQFDYILTKNIIEGVRLAAITFTNGTVSFIPGGVREDLGNASLVFGTDAVNTEARALGSINVVNKDNTLCRKINFAYDYFVDNATLQGYFANYGLNTDKKRLKLASIQESSCDGTVLLPPHSFEYFTEKVPRRLSFGQDHWGFYNGVTSNTQLMPTYTENDFIEILGANRESAWPAMRGGTLKRINYPTGGYSEFEFESNYTWASNTKYNDVYSFYISMGYGGNPNIVEQTRSLNGLEFYKVNLSNALTGGGGILYVYNASNSIVFQMSADPGESKTATFQVPSTGTYKITIYKSNLVGSQNGVEATFYKKESYIHARNEMVGGLRIKKLTHADNIGTNSKIINYSYVDGNNRSSGILYSRPTYVQVVRNDELAAAGFGGPYGNGPANSSCSPNGCVSCDIGFPGVSLSYLKCAGGLRPLSTSQGNHIGYNEVKVSQTGQGNVVYRYYGSDRWDAEINDVAIRNVNMKPPCSMTIPNYPDAPLPFEPKRGEPKSESYFTESGQWIKEVEYYHVFAEEPVKTPGRMSGSAYGWKFNTYYELKAIKKIEQTILERTIATPTLTVTTSTFFESPYHYQPTRILLINSTSQPIETKFKYAPDYRIISCDAINDCHQAYINAVNSYTSSYVSAKFSCSTDGCVWNTYQQYRGNLALARRNYLACRAAYLNPANSSGFAHCKANVAATADGTLKSVFNMVERNILVPIEKTEWKGGMLTAAIYNKYAIVSNTAGVVYLDKVQKVALEAPTQAFTPSAINGNTINKDSRYTDEVIVKFVKGNLAELTKKDGIVTSYIWGYGNTLPVAKISGLSFNAANAMLNQDVIQSPANEQALLTELNKLRASNPTALVTTYSYKPLIGITTEVDPNNKATYYEYDGLGRLLVVRDDNKNILKRYCYSFQGELQPCTISTAPNWQPTGSLRCVIDGSGQYTGYQEREERDSNPNSTSFNTPRWVSNGYSTTACPLPSTCNAGTCVGEGKKCINGVCETGVRIFTGECDYDPYSSTYTRWYYYEWSDGSMSNYYALVGGRGCL